MAKEKKEFKHNDVLGRPLKVGDPVAVPVSTTQLMIGKITAIGEKKVRVIKYGESERKKGWKKDPITGAYKLVPDAVVNGKLRFPHEVVLLDGPDVTMYLLKLQ